MVRSQRAHSIARSWPEPEIKIRVFLVLDEVGTRLELGVFVWKCKLGQTQGTPFPIYLL